MSSSSWAAAALAAATFLALAIASAAITPATERPTDRDAELVAASRDESTVKKGKATYVALCQSCHGDEKTTIDAPTNLFDAKWHHGGRPSEIERSILEGYLEKGMPPWKDALPPEDITALTAYLLSFQKKS